MESKQTRTYNVHETVEYVVFIFEVIKHCYQTCSVLTSFTLLQIQSWKTSFKNWRLPELKIYLPTWIPNGIELPASSSSFILGTDRSLTIYSLNQINQGENFLNKNTHGVVDNLAGKGSTVSTFLNIK